MLRNATFSAWFATVYLVLYTALLHVDATYNIAAVMLLLSTLVVVWMAFTAVKHGKYSQPELNGEEFGYQDRDKGQLGVF
jgi:hypothetical protein